MHKMPPNPNVVKFLGIVDTPFCIVTEFCANGDLHSFLMSNAPTTLFQNLSFCIDIW